MSKPVHMIRMGADGRYFAYDDNNEDVPLFTHRNRRVVEHWIAQGGDAQPESLKADPGLAGQALLNDTVAHIANIWGPYEMPRFGLTECVRHTPTGKLCVVKGYVGWVPPILMYSLEEVDGAQLEFLTPLSDMTQASGEVKS